MKPGRRKTVDVLVTKKDIRKAVRVLEEAFPYLQVTDYETVACFIDPVTQKGLIDVMKPATRTSQLVFRNTVPIGDSYAYPTWRWPSWRSLWP